MRFAICVGLLTCFGTGCVPVTEPVGDVDKAEPDNELLGEWKDDGVTLKVDLPAVKGNPKGLMRATLSGEREPIWFHVTRIGNDRYANVSISADPELGFASFEKEGAFAAWYKKPRYYFVFRYTLDGDSLTIDIGREATFTALMNKEKLPQVEGGLFYQVPPGWLAKHFAKNGPNDIFDGTKAAHFNRVKKK